MKKILVHSCCAPCSTYPYKKLSDEGFLVKGYFYNPNIFPVEEYNRRLNEFKEYMNKNDIDYYIQDANFLEWEDLTLSLKNEKEGGERCTLCFKIRLELAAIFAKSNGFDAFTTVLTVSPHKNSRIINEIGSEFAKKHDIAFIEENFKKQEGFKKSLIISKENNLYRQSYCGCKYSILK
ncbi:MAG: epoxyqueuosine reductase QueH [bacterium]